VVVDAVVGRAADIKPLLAEFGTWEEKKITDPAGGQGYDPAAITDYQAIDRIIAHLKLTFEAAKPPPCSPHGFHEGRRLMSSSRLCSRRSRRTGTILDHLHITE